MCVFCNNNGIERLLSDQRYRILKLQRKHIFCYLRIAVTLISICIYVVAYCNYTDTGIARRELLWIIVLEIRSILLKLK